MSGPDSNGKVPEGASPPPPRALPGGGDHRRHVIVAIVLDKPGVLNRVSSLMRARNFNIDSLAVSRTDQPDVSRMTITLHGDDVAVEQAAKQLYRLIDVLKVSDLTSELVGRLQGRRWSTDILRADGTRVFVSGGTRQGIKVGDRFAVETRGETVKSSQSGLPITLPGSRIAELRIVGFFGDDEYSEGSVADVISGSIAGREASSLVVVELQ